MEVNKNINAYKTAFGTLDKMEQVIMLYDLAVASIHQAKEAIKNKDIQEKYNKLEKAYTILSGLRDCLDFEAGGEVALTLKDWYTGTAMRVISINSSEDIEMCDLCIENIKQMRAAWVEVDMEVKNISSDDSNEPKANANENNSDEVSSQDVKVDGVSGNNSLDAGNDYITSPFQQSAEADIAERISALRISV